MIDKQNSFALEKKKVIEAVYKLDIQKLLELSNDIEYKDKPLQDVRKCLLFLRSQ